MNQFLINRGSLPARSAPGFKALAPAIFAPGDTLGFAASQAASSEP
jgi:hypothetical protein